MLWLLLWNDAGIPGQSPRDTQRDEESKGIFNVSGSDGTEILEGGNGRMRLYELTEQWDTVFNMMEDGETDEQVIFDTLEAIEGEIEYKADNYAKIIRNLQASVDVLKAEEERLYQRRRSTENHIQRMKNMLQANLEHIGKIKFKTDLFSFSVSKNGGKQPLSITENLDEIPGKYLIPQPPKVNNDAVRELLKDKEVEWAHLEPYGRHLNIR